MVEACKGVGKDWICCIDKFNLANLNHFSPACHIMSCVKSRRDSPLFILLYATAWVGKKSYF